MARRSERDDYDNEDVALGIFDTVLHSWSVGHWRRELWSLLLLLMSLSIVGRGREAATEEGGALLVVVVAAAAEDGQRATIEL